MTTTDKELAASLRKAADHMQDVSLVTAWEIRAEADRLDPPAPMGKTVTWEGVPHRRTSDGRWVEYKGAVGRDRVVEVIGADGRGGPGATWVRAGGEAEFYAVVLPLLADAPDGPIPDETVQFAMARYDLSSADRMESWRVALAAVRGLPGMAVVRVGEAPEVLGWGRRWRATNGIAHFVECDSRDHAVRTWTPGERVVAIIADPGEGTV